MSKAQAFTVDALFAFVIFVIILVFFFQVQDDATSKSLHMQQQEENTLVINKAINSLLYNSDDSTLGLIDGTHRFIELQKLNSLFSDVDSSYSSVQKQLGLGGKEFYVKAYLLSGSTFVLYDQSGNLSVEDDVYQREYLLSLENKSTIKFVMGVFS